MDVIKYVTCSTHIRPSYQILRKFVHRLQVPYDNLKWSHLTKATFEWYAQTKPCRYSVLKIYYSNEPDGPEKTSALNFVHEGLKMRNQLQFINQSKFLKGFDNFCRF